MEFNLVKQTAKKVKPQYWLLVGIMLFVTAFSTLLSELSNSLDYLSGTRLHHIPTIVSLMVLVLALLTTGPFRFGYSFAFLKVSKLQRVKFGDVFSGFGDIYGKAVGMSVLLFIKIFLWSLLFVIPGIVKGYAYYMSYFIMIENPEIKVNDAIKKSNTMMKGHKGELFVLNLMLIPYYLPAIALIITSYILTRNAEFTLAAIFQYLAIIAVAFAAPLMHNITADFYYILKNEYVSADGEEMEARI